MKEFRILNPVEQTLACRTLVLVAKNTSHGMDKLILWMLTAFGAGFTYLLGQQRIQFAGFKNAGLIYLAAALIGAAQRCLAMIVANSAEVFREAEKLHDNKVSVDLASFLIVYIDSLSGFQGGAAAWAANKLMRGDLVAAGKALLKITIWQCAVGFVCAGFLFWAACVAFKNL